MLSEYPCTMSCMEAFDQLVACYSVGGQFRSYYRYGEFNPCQKQLSKFKFCLGNSKNPIKVQEWYKEQAEYNSKFRGSSNAIWNEREPATNVE
ncbi:Emi1p NDAI_0F04440 [Naumovozyma dairenensis CBS 421]|uniref:Early meiotic induction protein 1 n=1 Tax=Naumovozyma dairenensis (strain ATCC 10597 / BCRC 20456 / CBS 421 / NBRC 0211 / NRRL Y-12639) TaxID=1071378 RepID=G0WDA1_NAUDC|nr:hypothetical protein NDAI_0F04440 [Naumovozyma dairenensis CBS 421]CCD25762.1 hypothetical protein NDAI_0F04440 [Naumovozyma dairenensis CBS 421]